MKPILCVLLLLVQNPAEADEPPAVGRPPNFSGAIGPCRVSARAEPTKVQAEEPIVYTLRISGNPSLKTLDRPDLRKLPRFSNLFHITNRDDRYNAAEQAREFDFVLRPRNAGVKEIPAFPFVYFKRGMVPAHLGYQTGLAPAIPLVVES